MSEGFLLTGLASSTGHCSQPEKPSHVIARVRKLGCGRRHFTTFTLVRLVLAIAFPNSHCSQPCGVKIVWSKSTVSQLVIHSLIHCKFRDEASPDGKPFRTPPRHTCKSTYRPGFQSSHIPRQKHLRSFFHSDSRARATIQERRTGGVQASRRSGKTTIQATKYSRTGRAAPAEDGGPCRRRWRIWRGVRRWQTSCYETKRQEQHV